jgi:ketosteroid isomerase-like protein
MSQENLEIVRRVINHVDETGEAGPLELYDEDVTFRTRGASAVRRHSQATKVWRDALAMFGQVWAQTAVRITELIEGDEVVVAVVRIELRSQTGVGLVIEEAWAYWLRAAKLVRIEQHGSRQEALTAAGL